MNANNATKANATTEAPAHPVAASGSAAPHVPHRDQPVVMQAPHDKPKEGVPFIETLTPSRGHPAGGEVIQINGSGLKDATEVTFGGFAGTDLKVHGDGRLEVTTPPGDPGLRAGIQVPLVVVTPKGNSDAQTFSWLSI